MLFNVNMKKLYFAFSLTFQAVIFGLKITLRSGFNHFRQIWACDVKTCANQFIMNLIDFLYLPLCMYTTQCILTYSASTYVKFVQTAREDNTQFIRFLMVQNRAIFLIIYYACNLVK